jgi:predicted  nucleic acid-binding Zn-ribbon protein
MSGPAEIIREIHRLRRFARDLQEQIDRGPKQLKAQQTRVARQEEAQREAQDALKKLKVQVHEKETSLKTTHALIVKHKGQLNAAASKKEYDALAHELATEQARFTQLEDEILAGMAEIEERTAQLPELEKGVQAARAEYKKFEAGAAERQVDLTRQLNETTAKLKEVEPTIPAEVRTNYNRIVAGLGADAFAAVADRNCGACNTAITAQQYTELLMRSFVLCKSCGRMLYLPE